jgi:hypothetical protein
VGWLAKLQIGPPISEGGEEGAEEGKRGLNYRVEYFSVTKNVLHELL